MEFLNEYLVAVVIGVCLCIGFIVKHFIPTDGINKYIPLIVGVLGVLLNVWLNEWTFTPEIFLGGLVSGLASTGMHEAFAQFTKKRTETKEDTE